MSGLKQIHTMASHDGPNLSLASPHLRNQQIRERWAEQKQAILNRRRDREASRARTPSPILSDKPPASPTESPRVVAAPDTIEADRLAQKQAMLWLDEQATVAYSPSFSPVRSPVLRREGQNEHQDSKDHALSVVLEKAFIDEAFRQSLIEVLVAGPTDTRRAELEARWIGDSSSQTSSSPPLAPCRDEPASGEAPPSSPPRVLVPFSPRPGELLGAQLGIFGGWGYLIRKQTLQWLRRLLGGCE